MPSRRSLLFIAFAVVCHCAQTGSDGDEVLGARGPKARLTVKGSDTMVVLAQRWAEDYAKVDTGASVQVTGGGTGTGIAALINGATDICQASRPMTDEEKHQLYVKRGARAKETKVAVDAIAVYVNARNPIDDISLGDLARIYRGEIVDWRSVGGTAHSVVLYGRENSSGTYACFKDEVLEGREFAASTQTLGGTSAVASAVRSDEYGIGYGGIAYLEGVKALRIRMDETSPAVAPSVVTVHDGSYPISRFLYFYTAGEPTADVQRFIDWVRGPEGQKVVDDVGYFPLRKE